MESVLPGKTIVLIAHGSGVESYDRFWKTRVLEHVRREFPGVTFHMGFLNGLSSPEDAFPDNPERDWIVLPLVLADGVVTRIQIPSALRAYRNKQGKIPSVEMLSWPGCRPELERSVFHILEKKYPVIRDETGVLVVQHGSMKRPTRTGEELALRWAGMYPEYGGFYAGYLSQKPRLDKVLKEIPFRHILVINWFLNRGNHVMADIPVLLGIHGSEGDEVFGWHETVGRKILYGIPMGEFTEFLQAVDGIIRERLIREDGNL